MTAPVRIELSGGVGWDQAGNSLRALETAEIWLAADDGIRINRARKPAAVMVDSDRPALLRKLADWIESQQDPALGGLAEAYAAARAAGLPGHVVAREASGEPADD